MSDQARFIKQRYHRNPVLGSTIRAKLIKTTCKMVAKMQSSKPNPQYFADCLAFRLQAHTAFERARTALAEAEALYAKACHHQQLRDLEGICE